MKIFIGGSKKIGVLPYRMEKYYEKYTEITEGHINIREKEVL